VLDKWHIFCYYSTWTEKTVLPTLSLHWPFWSKFKQNICSPLWVLAADFCPQPRQGTSVVAVWLSTIAFYVPLSKCAAVSWVQSERIIKIRQNNGNCSRRLVRILDSRTSKQCYNISSNKIGVFDPFGHQMYYGLTSHKNMYCIHLLNKEAKAQKG
jgi:hypothetical protein